MRGSRPRGSGRRAWIAGALVLTLAASVALATIVPGEEGPGADDFEVAPGVEPVGEVRAGSVAQLADCTDWNEGSVAERRATVVDIREQLNSGGVAEGRPSLSDPRAYEIFESACSRPYAHAFLLYKLYYQANAFDGATVEGIDVPTS